MRLMLICSSKTTIPFLILLAVYIPLAVMRNPLHHPLYTIILIVATVHLGSSGIVSLDAWRGTPMHQMSVGVGLLLIVGLIILWLAILLPPFAYLSVFGIVMLLSGILISYMM